MEELHFFVCSPSKPSVIISILLCRDGRMSKKEEKKLNIDKKR